MARFNFNAPVNYGLTGLMSPTRNFAQLRYDRDRELQLNAYLADQARMDRVELQQQVAQHRQQLQRVNNLSLLAPDQNRVNVLADELEKKIADKVRTEYGGDVRRYLMEAADADREDFFNTVSQSEAYQNGQSNKVNMARFIQDQQDGKIPMLINGRSARDVYNDFQNGTSRTFAYGGGYKRPVDFAKRIQDSYGKDRFTREAADPARVILELQQDGLNLNEAVDYYQQAGLDRNPIYYKSDDLYDRQKFEEESALRKARINKLNQPPKQPAQNIDALEAFKSVPTQDVTRTFGGATVAASVSNPLSKAETDLAMNLANGRYDDKTGYHILQRGQKLLTADGTREISGIQHVYNPRIVVLKDPNNSNLDRVFLQVDGAMTEGNAEKTGSLRSPDGKINGSVENFFVNDDVIGGSALINKAPWYRMGLGGGDENGFKYEVKDLLIPIGDKTALGQMLLNKQANIGSRNYNPLDYEDANVADALYAN